MACSCRYSWLTDAAFPFCGFVADRCGIITGITEPLSFILGYSGSEVAGKYNVTLLLDSAEVGERAQELSRLFGRNIYGPEALLAIAALDGKEIRRWSLRGRRGNRVSARLHVVAAPSEVALTGDFLIFAELIADDVGGESPEGFFFPDERPQQLMMQALRNVFDPVNTMMAYASLLKQDLSGLGMTGHINQILDEGRRLLQFLSRSSELTQMISGFFPVEIQPVSVADCLMEAIADCRGSGQAGGLMLDWNVYSAVGDWVRTDKQRFCRMIQALISVSTEKTVSGTVSIQVRILPDQDDGSLCNLSLEVFDTGVPITEAYSRTDKRMHHRYVQVCAESLGGSVKWSLPSDFSSTRLRCSVSIPAVELAVLPPDVVGPDASPSRQEVACN